MLNQFFIILPQTSVTVRVRPDVNRSKKFAQHDESFYLKKNNHIASGSKPEPGDRYAQQELFEQLEMYFGEEK